MKSKTAREKFGNRSTNKKLVGRQKTQVAHVKSTTKSSQRKRDIRNA